jgi:hypothetical protein
MVIKSRKDEDIRELKVCRSIKKLRRPELPPSEGEVHEAALQFVRKISGFHRPSRMNEQAFEAAVSDVAEASRKLLDELLVRPQERPSHTQVH